MHMTSAHYQLSVISILHIILQMSLHKKQNQLYKNCVFKQFRTKNAYLLKRTGIRPDNAKLQFHMCWWLLFTEFTPFLRVYCYMIKRSACFHICPCLLKYSGTYAKWYLLLNRIHRRSISNLVFKMHLISLMHWVLKWIKYCPMDVIICLATQDIANLQ